MFTLARKPTFIAVATVHVPGEGPASIEVEFRHLEKTERLAYFEGLAEKTNLDALTGLIVGWKGVDTPYSHDALSLLLDDYPSAATALFDAYFKENAGAIAKN
jgi:hypothetical protein